MENQNPATEKFSIVTFLKEVYDEMTTKVTWPTWQQLWDSAVVVIIAMVIFSLIIFLMDFIFGFNPNDNAIFRGLLYYIYSIFN